MASLDIGIDLGTYSIIASDCTRGIVVKEPSVVAINSRTGAVIGIGADVYKMIGRTPGHIQVVRPLLDGVVSNYKMTEVLIDFLLKRICRNTILRPRVTVCVPSSITEVESQAVIDATVAAGARKVYLIEEPVAAAIGAGIELSRPNGNMVVDIGGGTCDIAVLSLNGIVCKTSLRTAGQEFDEAIIRYLRSEYNLLIGEKTAEELKMQIGSVFEGAPDCTAEAKGRDLLSGLPKKIMLHRAQLYPALREVADMLIHAVQEVLERTPPELVGDIRDNGIILTGGGALIHGLCDLMTEGTRVDTRIAERPEECVAIGTAKSFAYLDTLFDGFLHTSTHVH